MQIFVDNMKRLDIIKRRNPHATFGVSLYSHLSDGELLQLFPTGVRLSKKTARSKMKQTGSRAALKSGRESRLDLGVAEATFEVRSNEEISTLLKGVDTTEALPESFRIETRYLSPIQHQ
eukprot:TRINITY_DN14579_c0_g1_i1.p1 TRINITY_DN14579_c0_g1~~TRINITY_DN14579_c0_g1_i1.p1  ORF type:complete len:120 (-),score=11.82 TRINITY_DN14579_c0_g1_i1:96-455(-)